MALLNAPVQLRPVFKEKIWGRSQLHPSLPPRELDGRKIGEIWVTDEESELMTGPLKGKILADACRQFGSELCGTQWHERRFPVLAKYLFTEDWISLQVHPDDKFAQEQEAGSYGKTEMWYFLDCPPKTRIHCGLRAEVTPEQVRAAADAGTLKSLTETLHPNKGEAFVVLPGRVHAIGPGLMLFEVEQNSDITYRLDDFGRLGPNGQPRPLHLDKALAVMRYDLPDPSPAPLLRFPEPFGWRRYVIACRYFGVECLTCERDVALVGNPKRVEILTFLDGAGRFETPEGTFPFQTGQTWLVPPQMPPSRLAPDPGCEVLRYYVPDLEKDFAEPLRAHGVDESTLSAAVHTW